MCGRFALIASTEDVVKFLSVLLIEEFPPRYNIAPTQPVLVVREGRGPDGMPQRQAMLVRWGLMPAWVKDPKDFPLLFNARCETAAEKAAFRAAMRHRRVLVPATGFYEWRREGGRRTQPYWIRPRHGGLIAFAGLMETWIGADGSEIDTGTILTTAANSLLGEIHERMPVVIRPDDFDRWLDCRTRKPRDIADLLRPVEDEFFEAVPISERVNKVANAGPDLQQRVEEQPREQSSTEPEQFRLF